MKRNDLLTAVIAFFVLSLVLVVFHASALAADSVPKERKIGEQLSRQWTVMLYFDGDNGDLEGDFITAFQKMAKYKIGSNEMANIVVQFDRIPGYDTSYGDWPICHRFFLTPGLEPTEENAIADWGDGRGGREVAMDSPQTLTDFINWSTKNYPAKKYALVAADHGLGWQGLCMDVTSDQDRMFLNEFQQALDNAHEDMDLLLLDDCEMQTIEVAFQLKHIGPRLLVGSQCSGSAWPYWDFLTAFTQKTSLSELQIAKRVVDAYYNWNKGYENATLSVVDLTKIEALAAKVKELAQSMRHCSDFSVVQAKARAVMPLVEDAVKYAKNVGYWQTYAHGISIYFPKAPIQKIPGPPDIFDNYYIGKVTDFARQMAWRDFLYCYYSRISPPPELKCQVDIKISNVRKQMTEIGGTKGDIDLYDFCKRLVDVKLKK